MILDPKTPNTETHNRSEINGFWDSLEEHVKLSTSNQEDDARSELAVNTNLVQYLKSSSDSYKTFVNTDHDLYRVALTLTGSSLFKENTDFCLSKMLSLLSIDLLELNMKFIIAYILLFESKKNVKSLEVMLNYQGFTVFYNTLYTQFAYLDRYGDERGIQHNQVTNPNIPGWSDIDLTILDEMKQISVVLMDLLFQTFKFCLSTLSNIQLIDDFFIHFILSTIRSDTTDDMFNNMQFRLILALNEQYIMYGKSYEVENKVFKYVLDTSVSKSFAELLLLKFNRNSDNSLKIMMCKMLYLILNTSTGFPSIDLFYLNDLHVLADVLVRELQNTSSTDHILRNTFLRVLYPLLQNKELTRTCYRKDDIRSLLIYLGDIDKFKDESKEIKEMLNTKHLAIKCLTQVGWLDYHDISFFQSNSSSSSLSLSSSADNWRSSGMNVTDEKNKSKLQYCGQGNAKPPPSESLMKRKSKKPPPPPPRKINR